VAAEASRADVQAVAIVVDHDIQEGSAAVAERAAKQCRDLGLEAEVVRVTVVKSGDGLEAAARDARYVALDAAADRWGADAILLGHTMEDQAETVLMRLSRGSGARSLAGIPAKSGRLLRPLLGVPRSTVRSYVADLDPWEDPHNFDLTMLRPRVRSELLPMVGDVLGAGAIAGLARTANLLRADSEALDDWAMREFERLELRIGKSIEFDVHDLLALPEAVRTRVIRLACQACGCPSGTLAFDHIFVVHAFLVDWRGQGAATLPGGVTAQRRYDRLCLTGD
jgi:tRNA(Ile)-lysidine synthetase-like protein